MLVRREQHAQLETPEGILLLEDIGKIVKKARESAEWKQEALAKELNCHPTYFSKIESGKGAPSIRFALKLEQLLHLPTGTIATAVIRHRLQQHILDVLVEAEEEGLTVPVKLAVGAGTSNSKRIK